MIHTKNWCVYQRVHHSWQGDVGKKETKREKTRVRVKWAEKTERAEMQACAAVLCFGFWFSNDCWEGRNAIFGGQLLIKRFLHTVPEVGGNRRVTFKHPRAVLDIKETYLCVVLTCPWHIPDTVKCWKSRGSYGNSLGFSWLLLCKVILYNFTQYDYNSIYKQKQ